MPPDYRFLGVRRRKFDPRQFLTPVVPPRFNPKIELPLAIAFIVLSAIAGYMMADSGYPGAY